MKMRRLEVQGAYEFQAEVFPDHRGHLVSPYQEGAFREALGSPLFPVLQVTCTRSRRGAVRGVHYTRVPPGMGKFVYCPAGRARDITVDLRVGSPTFGRWCAVELTPDNGRAVYLPVGAGHAVVALEDGTVVNYLMSQGYVPDDELAVSVRDPELDLPLLDDPEPILSARDADAPTVARALADGLLPSYDECVEREPVVRR